jgi:aspartate aminotransferase
LKEHRPAPIYLSNPTWGNHPAVFIKAGMDVRYYRYFDNKTKGLDFNGMI